jgi:hypothetical protein
LDNIPEERTAKFIGRPKPRFMNKNKLKEQKLPEPKENVDNEKENTND